MTAFDPQLAARIAASSIPLSAHLVQDADRMTAEREAEIRARVEAATKGPWWTDTLAESDGSESIGVDAGGDNWVVPCQDLDPANAEFIAHAREDVDLLLAELAAVRAERDEARARVADAIEYGVRIPDGDVLSATTSLTEQQARLLRYRDCWPEAVLVQRSVFHGEWTEVLS